MASNSTHLRTDTIRALEPALSPPNSLEGALPMVVTVPAMADLMLRLHTVPAAADMMLRLHNRARVMSGVTTILLMVIPGNTALPSSSAPAMREHQLRMERPLDRPPVLRLPSACARPSGMTESVLSVAAGKQFHNDYQASILSVFSGTN